MLALRIHGKYPSLIVMEMWFAVDGLQKGHLMNVVGSCIYFFFLYLAALVLHSVCNAFPNSSLNGYPCTLTYNATTTGLWAVALKIEDFEFSSSTKPLSGSSIQFIVFVEPSTNSCKTCMKIFDTFRIILSIIFKVPAYYGEQPPNACISANVGSTVNEIVQFSIGCIGTNIIEVEVFKPDGSTKPI
jgi:hypothetical protein